MKKLVMGTLLGVSMLACSWMLFANPPHAQEVHEEYPDDWDNPPGSGGFEYRYKIINDARLIGGQWVVVSACAYGWDLTECP